MNTFFRYLVHFLLICTVILVLIVMFAIFGGLYLDKYLVFSTILGVLFFSIVMAGFFANFLAGRVEIQLDINSEDQKSEYLANVDEYIISVLKRDNRIFKNDNYIIYGYKGKYNSWLTSPIEIMIVDDSIKIITPKAYSSYFLKLKPSAV